MRRLSAVRPLRFPVIILGLFLLVPGCQGRPEQPAPAPGTTPAQGTAGLAAAAELFAKRCAGCHGRQGNGRGSRPGPPLDRRPLTHGGTPEAVQQSIRDGRPGGMPAFGNAFSPAQIEALARYVLTLARQ